MTRTYSLCCTFQPKRRKSQQDPHAGPLSPLRLPSLTGGYDLAPGASFATLPDDIILLIINFLYVKDILGLRQTSRRFQSLTKLRWVWHSALKRHVVDQGLPVPAAASDLQSLSAEHLESRVIHALRFHENWNAAQPKVQRSIKFDTDVPSCETELEGEGEGGCAEDVPRMPRTLQVKQVLFLPGRNGDFVLTLTERTIACWEVPLDGSDAYRIAVWENAVPIDQMVVNEDPTHEAVLAFTVGSKAANGIAEVTMLKLDKFHGCFTVHSRARIRRELSAPLWLMRGDYLIAGEVLMVLFFAGPVQFVPLLNIHDISNHGVADLDNRVLTVKAIGRFLVILRERAIEVVYAPSWDGRRILNNALMEPGAYAQIDTFAFEAAVVVHRARSTTPEQPDWPAETVSILRRCRDDGVHTIEQFDLLPMPAVLKAQAQLKRPCVFPSEHTWIQHVAPSCGSLRAGAGGKGFWMQTENVTSRHSIYPARSLIGFDVQRGSGRDGHPESKDDTERQSRAGKHWGRNELRVSQNPVHSRRCAMGEIVEGKYAITSSDLEDSVGRIALGDRHGWVEILDFA
ncbi:hypothetical protein CERSUDRAFT_94639 [Gelatoporia subvermispora B]|uniref:F-box domain-containing protein n=1 Tax=Ceriporiopsis subvermispora (strain B) TaxID=914234 RepID=M2PML4_CERS8|nr:hypothetical protein CERSUDRAFT_94639 [Gelatoporia subvermispora B]